MGRHLSKEQLIKHKNEALKSLDAYMMKLINNDDMRIQGKSDKLSYWLEDWGTFLNYESEFSPTSLRRYKRGEIIKAHLGYNVGSEEGGLHYCVVLERNNSIHSPVITIVPLTSVKKKSDLAKLHKGEIYLGNELFTSLNSKISLMEKTLSQKVICWFDKDAPNKDKTKDDLDNEFLLLEKMKKEIFKMKIGSIALTGQIRTISKIRIYDPKTNFDILSNVKLSNEKLDLIDTEIIHNFTGQNSLR